MLRKAFKSQDSREGWHSYVRNFKKLYKTWETWDTAKGRRHRREQPVNSKAATHQDLINDAFIVVGGTAAYKTERPCFYGAYIL